MRYAGVLFCAPSGKVLLIQRAGHMSRAYEWDIPGGHIESGESPLVTAQRETVEEIGQWPFGSAVTSSLVTDDYVTFLASVRKQFDLTLSDEHRDWQWVLPSIGMLFRMHPRLRGILSGL